MGTRRFGIRRPAGLALAVLVGVTLTACGAQPSGSNPAPHGTAPHGTRAPQSHRSTSGSGKESSSTSASPDDQGPAPVALTPSVEDGATGVKVDAPISVKAADGTLDTVSMWYHATTKDGSTKTVHVAGAMNDDKTAWRATDRLEPGVTYKLKMSGVNSADQATTVSSAFSTEPLSLSQQVFPTLYPLQGSTVGVGMPVILTFDLPVKDKAEFEKHLTVTTAPKQVGSWHWYSDKEVHFRPAQFWQPGTKVQVSADLNSLPAGGGRYGQRSVTTSFTIGRSVVTKINLHSDEAKVYVDGSLARTIPVSAGKPGWVTRSGTKLIMDKLPVTRMTNAMIGAKETYDLQVKWAMRLTWSGEFLHAAPWNSANLGVRNASHGCVGMSTDDADWLFHTVNIGDPTITTGSDRGLETGNGWTDWNASFDVYKRGSALA